MKKSSRPRLHFRHADLSDSHASTTCCSIVDVCVNRELLADIRQNHPLEENGILLRLHWETNGKRKPALSTIKLYRGETSEKQISLHDAVVLATNTLVLREFATDMFHMFSARLVMIQYPQLVMTFQHDDNSKENMFSDEISLRGILKGLLSQCAPSEKDMAFSFSLNRGIKTRLPTFVHCQCFATSGSDEDHSAERSIRTADIGCQTDTYSPHNPTTMHSTNHCNNMACRDASRKIEQKFIAVEKDLTEQRKFIESQLNEQKQQNEEMKALLHSITENMRKLPQNEDTNGSHTSEPAKHILDEPNLMLPMENDEQEVLGVHKSGVSTEDNAESDQLSSGRCQKDNSFEDTEHVNVKSMETGGTYNFLQEDDHIQVKTKEEDAYSQEMHNDERTKETPRRGPMLTEISGTEYRSLPTLKAKGEVMAVISLNFGKTSSLPLDQRGHTCFEDYSDKFRRSRPKGENDRLEKTARYDNDDTGFGRDGRFWNESSTTTYRDSKTHHSRQKKSMGEADADLTTYADGHRTKCQLVRQCEDYGDFEDDDMPYYGHTSSRQHYSDLQRNVCNFKVTSRHVTTRYTTVAKTCLSDDPDGEEYLHVLIDSMIGDNPSRPRLWNSVKNALAEVDKSSVPRVHTALDTVILLDTSESISINTFQHMKATVLKFINGVENAAEDNELEENIGIVTFGGRAKILHHLSNDYGSIRDVIDEVTPGGPSPMLEGVLLSIVCLSKGGEVRFMDVVKLPPRLIIMTDGIATSELPETSADTSGTDQQQKTLLTNAFELLKRRQPGDYCHGEVTIIPLGNSDMSFLLSLAQSCGGTLIQTSKMKELCSYQRLHKLAGDTLDKVRCKDPSQLLAGLTAVALYPESQLSVKEWSEVCEIVKAHMGSVVINYDTICAFNNIHEVPGLPPLGTRVTRSVDWIWGNQDTEGAGTIFNHGLDGCYLWVLWDNGMHNVYRYGKNDCFDVQVVDDQPRQPTYIDGVCMGLPVERGPDWHVTYGNQDGGPGSRGVIVREKPTIQRVMVRWQNGKMYEYRYGENNMFDVSVLEPHACLLEATANA